MPPDPTESVALVRPDGTVGTAPAGDVDALLARGYTLADAGAVQETREQIQYGGMGSAALAATLGAGRAVTGGLSDVVGPEAAAGYAALLGQDPDLARQRARTGARALQTRQSSASLAGEILGYVAPVGAAGAVGRAGAAAERVALGAGTGVLRRGAAIAARGAVEGALVGTQQGVSELALEDREVTAERVASVLLGKSAEGALLGGGTAAGLHLGGRLLSAAARPSVGAVRSVGGKLFGSKLVGGAAESASGLLGRAAEAIHPSEGGYVRRLLSFGPEGQAARAKSFGAARKIDDEIGAVADDMAGVFKSHEGVKRQVMGDLKRGHVAKAVGGSLDDHMAAALGPDGVLGRARASLQELAADPLLAKRTKDFKRLASYLDRGETALRQALAKGEATSPDLFIFGDRVKREYGRLTQTVEASASKTSKAWDVEAADRMKGVYETLRAPLEDVPTWGRAADLQRTINAPWVGEIAAGQEFGSAFARSYGKDAADVWKRGREIDPGRVAAHLRALGTPEQELNARTVDAWLRGTEQHARSIRDAVELPARELAQVDEVIRRAESLRKRLDTIKDVKGHETQLRALMGSEGQSTLAAGAMGAGIAVGGPAGALASALAFPVLKPASAARQLYALEQVAGRMKGRVSSALRGTFAAGRPGGFAYRLPAVAKDHYDQARADAARIAVVDPAEVQRRVSADVARSLPDAPITSGEIGATAARAAAALRQAAPTRSVRSRYLLGPAPTPTPLERLRLKRAKEAIGDYPSVVDAVRTGQLSPASVRLMREVYPAEYADLQGRVLDEISDLKAKGEKLPYAQRRALGLLLQGTPVEPLQDPALVADMQAALDAPMQEETPPPQRKPREVRKRYETGSEETANEED